MPIALMKGMLKLTSLVTTYTDLAFVMKLISRRTPSVLIRRDVIPELEKRGLLERRADQALVVSELGRAVCRTINDGQHASELD